MGAYSDFKTQFDTYNKSNPPPAFEDNVSAPGVNAGANALQQLGRWKGTLAPNQVQEYDALAAQQAAQTEAGWAKKDRTGAMVAALLIGGGLAGPELAAGEAVTAGAVGAGDATAGMGWMGGAEMGTGAGAYGASAAPGLWGASEAATAGGTALTELAGGAPALTPGIETLPPVSVSAPPMAVSDSSIIPALAVAPGAASAPSGATPEAAPQGVDPNPTPDTSFGPPMYGESLGYSPGADITTTGVPSGGSSGGTVDPYWNWEGGPQGDMSQTFVPDATTEPSAVDKALKALGVKDIGSAVSKYGPAVGTLASMLKGRNAGNDAQSQFNAIAKPVSDTSNALLAQFNKGQITGADQYKIGQYTQQQTAAVNSYYAKAGLSNSSMHLQALDKVQQDAQGMRQQALQNMLNEGLQAAGIADPYLAQGIRASLAQDQQAQTNMAAFLQQLARMNTPAPTHTGTPG